MENGVEHEGDTMAIQTEDVTLSPLKTPMYKAMHAERYQRQAQIGQLQKESGSHLICYVSSGARITRDDTLGVVELLHNIKPNSDIDFLLHTGGGDIDAAEKLMSIVRNTVGTGRLRVIVPDFAKSAGTLMALAADTIVMSDSSELGPIDPQITLGDGRGNAIQHSVMSYLDAYEAHSDALRKDPNDVVAQVMLNKLDPATVKVFQAARNRAQKLANEHLNRWMFHEKKADYTKIASALMDNTRWLAHGQMIGYQTAQELELVVEYLPPDNPTWRGYWQLYCHQRLAIKDGQKLFESDYASLCM
ncbi:MAG: hypothetical protein HUU46_07750 [Candidatus Hydrogenedentes bacterium]|nr:hypothetical protein [Candidatus Hydrogenedentota bacterium]